MPERTPYLYAANTDFHKEVRNQPRRRGRTRSNAPSARRATSGRRTPGTRRGHEGDLRERPETTGCGAGADRSGTGSGRFAAGPGRTRSHAVGPFTPGPTGGPGDPGDGGGGPRLPVRAPRPRPAPAPFGGYLTGRWYDTRYRSAGMTTSAVSTARPEA
ncbi:hypothetical protein GCM10010335_69090 [Streptomyces galbus]|nr:hypothetical protein GCM10010335_69090 [Streptomyces galbus]